MRVPTRHAVVLCAAMTSFPALAQDVTLKFHHIWNTTAMASVKRHHAVVRQDRRRIEQPHEVPGVPGDERAAARRRSWSTR